MDVSLIIVRYQNGEEEGKKEEDQGGAGGYEAQPRTQTRVTSSGD